MIRERLAKVCKLFRRSSGRSEVEAQLNAAGPPWAGSVCGACERPECFGTCPGYQEYERTVLEEEQVPRGRCPNKNCAKCELEASRKKHDAYEKAYIKEARWEAPFWAVQQLEEFPGEDREADCLALITTMCEQEGFICGRIINPAGRGWWDIGPYNPVWKVQCFFEDCGEENAAHLPEGMRRVLLLPCMKKWAWYRRKV